MMSIMKGKLFIALTFALLSAGSVVNAQESPAIDEVRIYLNPGHGSWGPNNRPMNTIGRDPYNSADPDTTGFFESNTNLFKVYSLLDHLVEAGVPFDRTLNLTNDNPARVGSALDLSQHIVMSHMKVGPYPYTGSADDTNNAYNRRLSEIREEVEANNFDYFISVHSNAATDGSSTNYPLFLFRGQDDETYSAPGSKAFATHLWPYAYGNEHQTWSYYSMTNANVRGDVSFYGSGSETVNGDATYYGYLGVLLHGVPGFLVEGYFHTYQPARQRAMNHDVCRHEGHLYARGMINYFGWKAETTGDIYGIVRDLHERFNHDLYSPAAGTNDVYMPLNGVTVTLLKDGATVQTYTTDNEWNGAFFFKNLEPGTYSLSYAAEGYKAATEEYLATFTVTANETTYVNAFLESESYVPPTVVYENYPDPLEGNPGYSVASEYNVSKVSESDALATSLEGKTVGRQIVRNGILYVLATDESKNPYIYALNISDNTVSTISTTGLTLSGNKDLIISDIAFTADNYLVAASYGENQFSSSQIAEGDERGYLSVYKWALDENNLPTGDPTEWFTSQASGNFYNAYVGQTIAYNGTTTEGTLMTTAQTTGSSGAIRFLEFSIYENAMTATKRMNKTSTGSNYSSVKLGDDYTMDVSPRGDDLFVMDGKLTTPLEWQTAAEATDCPVMGVLDTDLLNVASNGAGYLNYADHSLMVAPNVVDNQLNGIKMFDITADFDNAVEITVNGIDVTSDNIDAVAASAESVVTIDDNGNVTENYLNFYVVVNGKITKYTTNGVDQPIIRGDFAYDLKATVGQTETTFTFKATSAGDGAINIVDPNTDNDLANFPITIIAGDNEVVLSNSDLPEGEIAWEVEMQQRPIPSATQIYREAYGNSRGVVMDTNPKSTHFGSIYVGNTVASGELVKGVNVYDPILTKVQSGLGNSEFVKGNTASPFRMNIIPEDGTVLITDWSDAHAGLYTMNPDTYEVTNMFQGTKASSGAFSVDGTVIGGGTTGVSTVGEGENLKLYTFCEDYPTGNAGNKIVRYDIGANRTISTAPDAVFETASALLINTNVEIRATEDGFWASQTRSAGNNAKGVPSLIYCDNEGNVVYNSGVSNTELSGSNGSGFAIDATGTRLAIADGSSAINIYDLTWNENVPTLTYLYKFATSDGVVNEMAFDPAGNLYMATRNSFQVWSMPLGYEGTSIAIQAAETIKLVISGIDEVDTDATKVVGGVGEIRIIGEAKSVSIYNMAGQVIALNSGDTMFNVASGLYIVIVDGKTTKVIVK